MINLRLHVLVRYLRTQTVLMGDKDMLNLLTGGNDVFTQDKPMCTHARPRLYAVRKRRVGI